MAEFIDTSRFAYDMILFSARLLFFLLYFSYYIMLYVMLCYVLLIVHPTVAYNRKFYIDPINTMNFKIS